jgi:galactokinase
MNESERDYDERDSELSAAARSLHQEWHTPGLWPAIEAGMRAHDGQTHVKSRAMGRWQAVAAAAVIAVTLAPTSWLGWRWFMLAPKPDEATLQQHRERLLTEDALKAIEESEAKYVQAIDELTRLAAPRLDMPDSPLLVNLQERLTVIDAAITEYRAEIERNRFNAHLRRQLLWIYQEKRRTLEQIQEYIPDAL